VYQYNATKTRWEKVSTVVSSILNATISINYHGYPDTYKYAGNVIVTVTWNQPVSSFTFSNLLVKSSTGYSFTVLSSSNSSTFQFSLSNFTPTTSNNAVQFYIPAGSVSALSDSTVVNNFPIFSPGFVINASRPLALLSMVYKAYSPVYSIISTTTGIAYYFATLWPDTTAHAIRIKADFKNPPTGSVNAPTGSSTSTFSYLDINAVTIVGSGSITIPSGDYSTFNGTVAASRTINPRYIDFYYGSDPGANQIVSITVPAGRYTDGSSSVGIYNTDSAPMYFGLLTYAANILSAVATKNVGDRTFTIAVNFDHFTPLLASLPSTTTVTLSTGSSLSSLQVSPTVQTGNQLIMQYTPVFTTTDFTENITIPVGWATFSGTSANIVKDPSGAANPFSTRSTVNAFTASFGVIISSPTITSIPANGATGVAPSTLQLNFNRNVNSVGGKYYQVTSGGSTVQGNTAIPSAVNTNTAFITLPTSSFTTNTSYSVTIDAGAYQDLYYNPSVATTVTFVTTATAPVGQQIILSSSTWTVPAFVNRISVLAVSQGAGYQCCQYLNSGGRGGTLAWRNCVVVNPGDVLNVAIGTNVKLGTATTSGYYLNIATGSIPTNVCGYGIGGVGGLGDGQTSGGGGGAGGYGGAGGAGGNSATAGCSAAATYGGGGGGGGGSSGSSGCCYVSGSGGGGVGIYGLGSTGAGGAISTLGRGGSTGTNGTSGGLGSSGGNGGTYGGGGGGRAQTCNITYRGSGGPGVIRIVYGKVNGAARQFPSTNVASTAS
jgi:hypothetical protein